MRYFSKNIIVFFVIFLCITAVFFFSGNFFLKLVLKKHFEYVVYPVVTDLASLMKEEKPKNEIRGIANKFFIRNRVNSVLVINSKGEKLSELRKFAPDELLEFITVKFQIKTADSIIGWFEIGPGYEHILRVLTGGKNLYFTLGFFILWAILISYIPYLYFRKSLIGFISKFTDFFENTDNKEIANFKFKVTSARWKTLSAKLNSIKEKYANTNALLNLLFSISKTLKSNTELNEIFNRVIGLITGKFEGVSCAIVTLGDDGFFKIRAQSGFFTDFLDSIKLKENEGFIGKAFSSRETIIFNDIKECDSKYVKDAMGEEGIESFVYIPIIGEGRCLGILNVSNKEKGYFTKEKMEIFSTFSEYLFTALQNFELFNKINTLNRRLEMEISIVTKELLNTNSRLINKANNMKALSDIVILAAVTSDIKDIFAMVSEKVKSMLSVEYAGFFLYQEQTESLMPSIPFFGISDEKIARSLKINEFDIMDSTIKEGKSYMSNNPSQSNNSLSFLNGIINLNSIILTPLINPSQKPLGIFAVGNKIGGSFIQEDVSLMELLADRIAGSVESIKLNKELANTVHDLTVFKDISSTISSEPVSLKIFEKVITTIKKAFEADLTQLLMYDEKNKKFIPQDIYFDKNNLNILHGISVDDENSIILKTFLSGEAFLSKNTQEDARIKKQENLFQGMNSLIIVPLKAESGTIGIFIIGKKEGNYYNVDSLKLADLVLTQAAVIIDNANLYDSIKKAYGELERLNQAKNEFIAMISNDISVPLLATEGFVKTVLSGRAGVINPQQEKFLKISYQSMEKLGMLVTNFIEITKFESGQSKLNLKPIKINEIIEKARETFYSEVEPKRLDLRLNIPASLPAISADKDEVIKIFSNLLLNCSKLALDGGIVEISGSVQGENVLFGISSNGIGIPKSEHYRIFDKFYPNDSILSRLVPVSLALCKVLIELHKGNFWVESDTGRGSKFLFTIPSYNEVA
ncbi:MAG: GAF domain-containing protein [Elusimicrobia bacterium]|nr:GAF domain-containing protein [Elusimicrobiota bacterium]